MPPTVTESLETDPVETVTFARDEGANVAWALEEAVEGPLGTRLDRHEQSQQAAGKAADAPVQPTTDADWAYRLSTGVPDYWHPLVPVRRGRRATDLERGEMLVADRDHDTDPKGAILDERDASIPEEEVPRTGKRVTRRYRHARWTDGSTHLWSSREATVGTGEVSSDLQFDVIAERPPGETGALSVAVVSQRSAGGTFENLDEEYVAFRNAAGRTLDLTGWTVADRAGHEYAFPEGFTIDAGDVVRLRTGEETTTSRTSTGIAARRCGTTPWTRFTSTTRRALPSRPRAIRTSGRFRTTRRSSVWSNPTRRATTSRT
ncbi:lamin tail domain-containing protein [Halorussus caseinilyticus]|uniref:Lamin tail domain-containing protein n=1 Tax=Halorussus caseinilyticus TaxID=3034025 RepID=A0ABD5WTZ7_9EURY